MDPEIRDKKNGRLFYALFLLFASAFFGYSSFLNTLHFFTKISTTADARVLNDKILTFETTDMNGVETHSIHMSKRDLNRVVRSGKVPIEYSNYLGPYIINYNDPKIGIVFILYFFFGISIISGIYLLRTVVRR